MPPTEVRSGVGHNYAELRPIQPLSSSDRLLVQLGLDDIAIYIIQIVST